MLVKVKLDISVGKRQYLSMLQTLLVFLILNDMVKTKLAILPLLCCTEIVKNSIEMAKTPKTVHKIVADSEFPRNWVPTPKEFFLGGCVANLLFSQILIVNK